MTQQQRLEITARLEKLERHEPDAPQLSEETLRDLRKWWNKKLYDEDHKVVSIDAYRWSNENF